MKTFLFLVLCAILGTIGYVAIRYDPVCVRKYDCPTTRDSMGNEINALCSPTLRSYPNRYQALLYGETIYHDGDCTIQDKEMRRL